MERDAEKVRANELDFAGDLAFCSWCLLYLSPLCGGAGESELPV